MKRHGDEVRAPIQTRLRLVPVAAGVAVALGTLATSAFGQTHTWTGPVSGNFSNAGNWQGTGPAGPGSATTSLVFTSGNTSAGVTATNDLGTPFVVNSLTFGVNNGFTVASSAAANLFQLVGPSPSITMGGVGSATMSATGGNIQLAADAIIGGSGPGNLLILGQLTESGGARSLTISGGGAIRAMRMVQLANASTNNTFTGGLILDGGTVTTNGFGPQTLGATGSTLTVTPNGGTINAAAGLSNGCTLGTIQLNGDLRVIGGGTLPLNNGTSAAVLQGSGSLILNNSSTGMTVYSNSPGYNGAAVINQSELAQYAGNAGTFTLSGVNGLNTTTNGAMTGAVSFDVRAGGTLTLSNTTANTRQNGDRIGDTTPVNIRSANFMLNGAASAGAALFTPANLTENIGTLSGAGMAVVTTTPGGGTGVTTTLNAASLSRVERGTFLFRGVGLGDGTVATRGNITFTSDPSGSLAGGGGGAGTSTMSILPFAIGDVTAGGLGSSFVTYGANGIRPLAASEYLLDDLTGAVPAANVKLDNGASGVPASTAVTVNSLVLATNGSNTGSVTGTGTLNVSSGAILCTTTAAASIASDVDFGSTEGVIYATGSGGLSISGALHGNQGLTKSGAGSSNNTTLTLSGDNSGLSGPLTINAGTINFNSNAALPGNSSIIVNGSQVSSVGVSAGLTYSGTTPLTFGRPVSVNTGFVTFKATDTTTGGTLTLDQPISGVGGVSLQGVINGAEIWVTNASNTYAGTTRVTNGNIHIAGEGSLGVGGGWQFAGGALILEGDVSNSRHVNFSSSGSIIDTNGHNATLTGPLTSFLTDSLNNTPPGGFTKNGLGTLNLTSPSNTVTGVITVNAGTLLINGNLGASATNLVNVNAGGILGGSGTIYRNVSVATGGTLAPGNSSGIMTIWGSMTLASSSTLSMELNGPAAGTGYDQIVDSTATVNPVTTVNLGSANLALSLGFAPSNGSVFWLINNTNAVTLTSGNFAGLPEGSAVALGSLGGETYTGLISYNANYATGQVDHSGNDVVIYNVLPSHGSCCVLASSQCFSGDTSAQCATRGGTWTAGGTCVGPSSCSNGHFCGTIDFNCDGDVGTDADIEAFFACLAGTCPSLPCINNADFNGDGDIGTDSDIEAFFRVLGGGAC
jgi:autotransporter-associated beta strand protein